MSINFFESWNRTVVIASLVIVISISHLLLSPEMVRTHAVARELYFLPIILSGFWFGLRSAVFTSMVISGFYLTFSLFHWKGFAADDVDRLLEIILFNLVAIVVGVLEDRQRQRNREKMESVRALAATVAHEINSPLFVAMGTLELLQEDFDPDTKAHQEINVSLKNLVRIRSLVNKISSIEQVVTTDYDGSTRMVDLEKSSTL